MLYTMPPPNSSSEDEEDKRNKVTTRDYLKKQKQISKIRSSAERIT